MSGLVVQLSANVTEADIQAALNKLPAGGTLVLPANATIAVTNGLNVDGSRGITLDLNGSTLQQAGDCYVLSVNGKMTAGVSAMVGHDSANHYTVTYSGASNAAVGDYIKLYADDLLPDDQGATTRLGQAMKIVAVKGNTVTLEGDLINGDLYKTNVRVAQYVGGDSEVKNGTVRGDQLHSDWQGPLVSVRSSVNTHLDNMTVRDGNSMGFNFVNTVNGLVTQSSAINLTDDTAHGHYGYGVHSASSVGTTVDGLYAEKVRHAVDDNAVGIDAGEASPFKYGADIGLTASNVVANATTSFAFSWHSEGRQGNYSDSVVFNSFGVVGARGTDNTVHDISGANNSRGLLFFEYGKNDGARITMDNINLKETGGYGVYNQNDPTANILSNSTIEVSSKGTTLKASAGGLTMVNTLVTTGSVAMDETINGTSGNDRLLGGKGVDVISGGAGHDYVWGGDGADVLTGGAGHDRFAYLATSEGGDTITDFQAGANGDVIDLAALSRSLGWKGNLFAKGYVQYVQSGADTLVQVDANGGANSFTTLATLKNVAASTLTAANVSTQLVVSDYTDASTPTGEAAAPVLTAPIVTAPVVTIPVITAPVITAPVITAPVITAPVITAPVITAPVITAPVITIPIVTTPTASTPTTGSKAPATDPAEAVIKVTDVTAWNDHVGLNKILGNSIAETLTGTSAKDLIVGGAGDDTLNGGVGDDVLAGGAGKDAHFGGAGNDLVSYADATDGLTASLKDASINTGYAAGDSYSQIENLAGSKYSDVLHGNDGVNVLFGGEGNDQLYGWGGMDTLSGGSGDDILDGGLRNDVLDGGIGNDRLIGGDGYDTLTGGNGNDVFIFDAALKGSFDTITDFNVGQDKFGLANTGLQSLSGVAFEVTNKMVASTSAPTLLYNSSTGALLFDADGKGGHDPIKLAMLDHMPSLHMSDFILI